MAVQFNDIIKAMNGAIEDFNANIPASQKSMLNAILVELKELDLSSNGDIKTSVQNLKVIGKIKGQLQNIFITDKYLDYVHDFTEQFLAVAQLQNEYWGAIEEKFKPGPLLAEIKTQAVTDTVNVLTENGISANIADALSNILQTAVSSGGSYAELTDQLRTTLTDQPGDPGLLSKYARTYTTDALNTFAAQYNQTISDDLGYTWFAYQGSDIETTRPFCDAMTDFTFFGLDEIPRLLKAENLYYTNKKTGNRELVPIYPKTGLPQGMKPNTTPSNFQTLRGGWNCGHQIRPVPASAVPDYIKNRDQIPRIMDKAKAGGPELDALGNEYAKKFQGSVTPLNYKSYESITRKSRDELGGDYTQLKDAVRNTVVVQFDQLDNIAKAMKADPRFLRVKVQTGPDFFGYKGILANVKLKNGTIAEMQVNVPSMIYAKEKKDSALRVISEAQYNEIARITNTPGGLGHEFYNKIRVIKENNPATTPAELAGRAKLIKDSEQYYSIFYEQNMATAKTLRDTPTLGQAEKAMDNFKPTEAQLGAVKFYTRSAYGGINGYLRKGEFRSKDKLENIELIKSFLEAAPSGRGTTYRGIALFEEDKYNAFLKAVKEDKIFKDNGFLSTSLSADEAATFSTSPFSVKLEIEGKTGVPIRRYSDAPDEQEVLFNIGTKFKVEGYEETEAPTKYKQGYKTLYVRLTEEVNPVLQSTRKSISEGVVDTKQLYSKDGEYESQRAQLHENIIKDVVAQGSTETGVVYVLGGAPAAGKSTLVKSGALPYPKDILILDPDAIKSQLPEYDAMVTVKDSRAAAFVHEESSTISKAAVTKILDNGWDFVNDSVMDGGLADVQKKVNQYHAAGKTVRADYVTVDTETSVQRAADRAFKTGRMVPEQYVLDMNREISNLVPELVKSKTYDELYLWDSNEITPRLILSQVGGVTKIADQALYERFLKKGSKLPEIVQPEKPVLSLKEAKTAMKTYEPTADQVAAVKFYTDGNYGGKGSFSDINDKLRVGTALDPVSAKTVQDLTDFLNGGFGGVGISYRGMQFSKVEYNAFVNDLVKNKVLQDKGFMSSTAEEDTLFDFIKTGGPPYRVIITIEGKTGVPLGKFTKIKEDESEILFNKGSKFEILESKESKFEFGETTTLELRVREI